MERSRLYATTNRGAEMKWIRRLWDRIVLEIRYRKKLRELRKRDPFIYK
jgi:hypothetical protein